VVEFSTRVIKDESTLDFYRPKVIENNYMGTTRYRVILGSEGPRYKAVDNLFVLVQPTPAEEGDMLV
jgi:hypothetical protein